MKRLVYLFSLLLLLSCDSSDNPKIVVCPPDGASMVVVLTVDYTTNDFTGGYTVAMPGNTLEMACDYKSPGDFGSVAWYNKADETQLFAGTIVWMGVGEQTFPEKTLPPTAFGKQDVAKEMPEIIPLFHDEFDVRDDDFDYTPIWKAVENLQCVNRAEVSTPVYVYLYRPSVGVGNPADWYWVIFLK